MRPGSHARWPALVVPDWLAEVVRPRPAPVPRPEMVRAALAICVPLSASLAAVGSAALAALELPEDEALRPVTEAVRALLGVLGSGERLAAAGPGA